MKYIEKINLNDQDFVFIPPAATAEQIGGIKAENATDENVELKIDEQGKLYAPQYPDFSGKLDKNQGEDNADKVFVINAEGNLEPAEFKGGSDNRLIANVEKVENANINDSYQAKIENLKLYGKSTQGAEPSPDNKQDIAAISKFSGQVNNGSEQSQPFTYTPTNPMYSTLDGNISDFVDVQNGNEVYNMSGEVVLDGNEDWSMSGMDYGDYVAFYLNGYIARSLVMCNKLPHYNFENSEANKEAIYIFGDGSLRILILKSRLTEISANGLKTWLSQNSLTVAYQLETPTKIPIDSEKLTVLRNLYTYKGTTNFLCNAPISFNYEQSVDLVIKDLLNKIQTTGANLLYLNGK